MGPGSDGPYFLLGVSMMEEIECTKLSVFLDTLKNKAIELSEYGKVSCISADNPHSLLLGFRLSAKNHSCLVFIKLKNIKDTSDVPQDRLDVFKQCMTSQKGKNIFMLTLEEIANKEQV